MQVVFSHFRHVFDEPALMRWTSPHFSDKEAGDELRQIVLGSAVAPSPTSRLVFDRSHMLCANEVFPEAAVADPVADLEIWDEWRSGGRAFPYPGKYSRLGLTIQEGKTSSKTSVGMIGEVFTGIFGQVYLSPWVLVRVIARWPDFIYYVKGGRYAFVESKAFTAIDAGLADLGDVPQKLLGPCLVDAARQLNTDPFVTVWLSFTGITSINPFCASVFFLELDAPDERRENAGKRIVPKAVISGLAHRAIVRAASDFGPDEIEHLEARTRKKKTAIRLAAEEKLIQMAVDGIEEELLQATPQSLIGSARAEVQLEIERLASKAYVPESGIARHFEKAKRVAAEGQLARIRQVGSQYLYLADMPADIRRQMETTWSPDWDCASAPCGAIAGCKLWRGSSAVLTLGGPDLDERNLSDATWGPMDNN